MPNNSTFSDRSSFNAINWFEIPTRDIDRQVSFYEQTLRLSLKRELFGGTPHAVFPSKCPAGATSVAGALVSDPRLIPGKAGTVVYFDCVDGVRAALERALSAGATLVTPHTPIGENGFIALVDDLEGNRIGLHAMIA
jgi:uncharacterized protein